MGSIAEIEIHLLESIQGGMAQFYTPQSSNETMLVQIPPGAIDKLFVHRFQTDQLLVVRESFVLVVLHNRQYRYVYLSETQPQAVKIPPGVPHGAINLNSRPCLVVNAVLRHGAPHPKDYRPIEPPFPYDLERVRTLLKGNPKIPQTMV
ncbi:dTDP-4-dehydrorhamnose 3,5-epimerase [Lusitaniella coriacea LEGE 07157]|uniref:dTDP-4-dehydrorhamnose 3,5-epimerase n=1 Tax=Lusitaniella coriacea LEGE 07157 TaxID=945747 RepID=A0A8J7DV53_9CYAN|nr:dTDP-4-dehydrorhamnose 3,5-epimerase [Lusitaniella coriacea]MBE9115568.1 dTDP-4-dehydrorhamnose 3,5-epimerase [Lusitaniella coriacea LEGE 07157]